MNNFHLIQETMGVKVSNNEGIKAGLCGTMFVGSDRYAVVVIKVLTPKKIEIKHLPWDFENIVETKDGLQHIKEEHLEKLINNSKEEALTYTLRRNKRWMPQGQDCWGTSAIHLGKAENYADPSF